MFNPKNNSAKSALNHIFSVPALNSAGADVARIIAAIAGMSTPNITEASGGTSSGWSKM